MSTCYRCAFNANNTKFRGDNCGSNIGTKVLLIPAKEIMTVRYDVEPHVVNSVAQFECHLFMEKSTEYFQNRSDLMAHSDNLNGTGSGTNLMPRYSLSRSAKTST